MRFRGWVITHEAVVKITIAIVAGIVGGGVGVSAAVAAEGSAEPKVAPDTLARSGHASQAEPQRAQQLNDSGVVPARRGTGPLYPPERVPIAPPDGAKPAPQPQRPGVAPPPDGAVAPRAVIGVDERVRVLDTTNYPFSAMVYFTFRGVDGALNSCSGWMISADTVATAGHCVYAPGQDFFTDFSVYPGRNGPAFPYGVCGAADLLTNTEWGSNGTVAYDYGAIKLTCDVGVNTGWLGFRTVTSDTFNAALFGYPGDKPTATLWGAAGEVFPFLFGMELAHEIDMFRGQSGAPLYDPFDPECGGPCGRGINTAESVPPGTNFGVGISEINGSFDLLLDWRN